MNLKPLTIKRVDKFIVVFLVLSIADWLSTVYVVNLSGLQSEVNPIGKALFSTGAYLPLIAKLFSVMVFAFGLYYVFRFDEVVKKYSRILVRIIYYFLVFGIALTVFNNTLLVVLGVR